MNRWIKSILITCAIVLSINAADVVWEGDVSSKWSTAGNWDGGSVPAATDTVRLNSTAALPCSVDVASFLVYGIQADATFDENFIDNAAACSTVSTVSWDAASTADTINLTGLWVMTGDGNWIWQDGPTYNRADVIVFGSGYNPVSLKLMGTGSLQQNTTAVGFWKRLECSYTGKTTTVNGSQYTFIADTAAANPWILNGGTFTINRGFYVMVCKSGQVFTQGTSTINGSQFFTFEFKGDSINATVPAISMSGSSDNYISFYRTYAGVNDTFNMSGAFVNTNATGGWNLRNSSTGGPGKHMVFNTNNYDVTTGQVVTVRSDGAGNNMILNCGSSDFITGYVDIGTGAGGATAVANVSTSTWTIRTYYFNIDNHAWNGGTESITFAGTGSQAQNMNLSGDTIYDWTINNTGSGAVTLDDSIHCHDFTIGATNTAPFSTNGKNFYVSGDINIDGSGTVTIDAIIHASGDVHIGSTVGVVTATGGTIKLYGANPTVDFDKTFKLGTLSHATSAVRTILTGAGTDTITNGPTTGDIVLNQTGTTVMGRYAVDSLVITAGTLKHVAGGGIDSIDLYAGIDGGTWDVTADTVVMLKANGGTPSDIIYSASSLWKILSNGAITGFDGDTLPTTQFLGSGGF